MNKASDDGDQISKIKIKIKTLKSTVRQNLLYQQPAEDILYLNERTLSNLSSTHFSKFAWH